MVWFKRLRAPQVFIPGLLILGLLVVWGLRILWQPAPPTALLGCPKPIAPPAVQILSRSDILHLSANQAARVRFLLATQALAAGQGKQALPWLQGLEENYPLLGVEVAIKQAQAYALAGNTRQALAAWHAVLDHYPNHPASAEALYTLGQVDHSQWDQALTQFPSHPCSVQIARQLLRQNPDQPHLLLLLARYGLYLPDITTVLDRLVESYGQQLQPAEWETVAFGYWSLGLYDQAGAAYASAAPTPLNLYRHGRGLQLGGHPSQSAYLQLVQQFPQAQETGLALVHLGELSSAPQAQTYLDRVVHQFPNQAPLALQSQIDLFTKTGKKAAAAQARAQLLATYSSSEPAAQVRWQLAQQEHQGGNLPGALAWARQVLQENPHSPEAGAAGFWAGRWYQELGKNRQARQLWQQVLHQSPHSYYAWRSAALLGLPGGDFTTINTLHPCQQQTCQSPLERSPLPQVSREIQELYHLHQDWDAWALWQGEFSDPSQPSVAEQFTDGLLRVGAGDYLGGIYALTSLDQRQDPIHLAQVDLLRRQPAYWYGIYPVPYLTQVESWARRYQLNPLLVMGLIRQESRFDATILSPVGAVGLMQVMPNTAAWVAAQIHLSSYTLTTPADNLHLGTWYFWQAYLGANKNTLLAVAGYNAGPGNVTHWVHQYGLGDPDQFVEQIPYPETRGYVKAVFGNYWNYLQLYDACLLKPLERGGLKNNC